MVLSLLFITTISLLLPSTMIQWQKLWPHHDFLTPILNDNNIKYLKINFFFALASDSYPTVVIGLTLIQIWSANIRSMFYHHVAAKLVGLDYCCWYVQAHSNIISRWLIVTRGHIMSSETIIGTSLPPPLWLLHVNYNDNEPQKIFFRICNIYYNNPPNQPPFLQLHFQLGLHLQLFIW